LGGHQPLQRRASLRAVKTAAAQKKNCLQREFHYLNRVRIGLSCNKHGVGAQYIAPKFQKINIRFICETDHLF
jgi:hypothetical protein